MLDVGMPLTTIATLLAALVAVAAAVGLEPRAASTVARGTLYGVLTEGPIRPVCRVDEPCDAPAPGVTLRFLRSGRAVARAVTRAGGRYRIRLRAGTYAVRTNRRPFGAVPTPATVRVVAGRTRRVDLAIDTGIR
jgi:hypothetical protein